MEQCAKFAVIGDPIAHSLSPPMQNAGFAALGIHAEYGAVHVRPEELKNFIRKARTEYAGINVTVPHKQEIIPFLDVLGETAELAGSVNTVINCEGRLYGESTDGYGLATALLETFGIDPAGQCFVFLGCGGTVHAVAPHLLSRGAAGVTIVNRTIDKAKILAAKLAAKFADAKIRAVSPKEKSRLREAVAEAAVVIQATSLGLKNDDPSPLENEFFVQQTCYYDTIYRETAFLRAAKASGARCAGGLGMLLHQGARSFSYWTGHEAPLEAMRKALQKAATGT